MSKPTIASLLARIEALEAKHAAPRTTHVEPSTTNVVLWKNDAQRRFWREKACFTLAKEQPEARSFPVDVVERKAEALFCAPRAAH